MGLRVARLIVRLQEFLSDLVLEARWKLLQRVCAGMCANYVSVFPALSLSVIAGSVENQFTDRL